MKEWTKIFLAVGSAVAVSCVSYGLTHTILGAVMGFILTLGLIKLFNIFWSGRYVE